MGQKRNRKLNVLRKLTEHVVARLSAKVTDYQPRHPDPVANVQLWFDWLLEYALQMTARAQQAQALPDVDAACLYCGWQSDPWPGGAPMPAAVADQVKLHDIECPRHPMRVVERRLAAEEKASDRRLNLAEHALDLANEAMNRPPYSQADRIAALTEERNALLRFKTWVHSYLDGQGVPADPDPDHTAATGCRISGRMAWLLRELANARQCSTNHWAEITRAIDALSAANVHILHGSEEVADGIRTLAGRWTGSNQIEA